MQNVKIWSIKFSMFGMDGSQTVYFNSLESAEGWYENHNYCDRPKPIVLPAWKASELLEMSADWRAWSGQDE